MKSRSTQLLRPYPIPEFGFGEYSYFVDTPKDGTLYFKNKDEAKEFIEFYNSYQNKRK